MGSLRKIIHIDMDCFYAAIEMREFPELKGKPIGIGGGERGVLSTANYEARKFGVKSALPTKLAVSLCPHLILRPHRFPLYKEVSYQIREIFYKYTKKVEPLSLDEAYLDVSDNIEFKGSATLLAQQIQKEIYKTTQLTASAGVGPNKMIAKVASDWNKPAGVFTVPPGNVDNFMMDLPVKKLFGVGKVMQESLSRWGIKTCGDLQTWDKESLYKEFGNMGLHLYKICRGKDNRKVVSSWERKSISVENTFSDIDHIKEIHERIKELYEDLHLRFEKLNEKRPIKTMHVKAKTNDFQSHTMDRSFSSFPKLEEYIKLVEDLFFKLELPVRLLGIGVRFEEKDSLRSLQLGLLED
ncbi:MAG: DNA polymerase IV [Bdellovibrionales bacterium]